MIITLVSRLTYCNGLENISLEGFKQRGSLDHSN